MKVIDDVGPSLTEEQREILKQQYEKFCENTARAKMCIGGTEFSTEDWLANVLSRNQGKPSGAVVTYEGRA
jgi:hypothetical protein